VTVEPILAGPGGSASASPGLARPLLRTENLTVRFGGLTALNGVDFAVPKGEVRAIIGPNGAGKSTFFNCLTGVLRPTSGAIFLAGDDITGLSSDRISQRGIARSYQITNILPNASVLENTRIAAQSRRHAWSLLTHHSSHRDVVEKAETALDAVYDLSCGRIRITVSAQYEHALWLLLSPGRGSCPNSNRNSNHAKNAAVLHSSMIKPSVTHHNEGDPAREHRNPVKT